MQSVVGHKLAEAEQMAAIGTWMRVRRSLGVGGVPHHQQAIRPAHPSVYWMGFGCGPVAPLQ
ncbi:hypothetical protein [Streptomyces sp. SAJ15]|uniref:hypothetical protein n=1 Tax=Streptomyces sp. SAJ15 TaxID=2011095 RepID=UPI001186FF16|nr:hypothetical protein [Streptomyces sp. SAJ15]TVL90237.1 hypothetical protein CD790_22195 [Streptomyces sp. SAJ15]